VRRHIDEAYSGANDHGIGRIANSAADGGLRSLGVGGNRANGKKDQVERNIAQTTPQLLRKSDTSKLFSLSASILDRVDLALRNALVSSLAAFAKFIAITLAPT
jgi:hypothetical protein